MKSVDKRKALGFFNLVMINVIAVDSLRSLPIGAEYGFSLIFFYLLAGLLFFIPSILVIAELATGWPNTGGIYVWVREAFGRKSGFFVIWFQWIYNVVWYPTIMAFMAGTIAYFFDPALAENKTYMLIMMMVLFWGATFANFFGMKVSSFLSTLGAIFGTLLPMAFIVLLGIVWFFSGRIEQIHLTTHALLPNMGDFKNLAFLSAVIFGLIGMEMSAVHAGDVRDPSRDYPKALIISGCIIFFSLIFASLAIALVIPKDKISLVTGLLQAFTVFFNSYHMGWMVPIMLSLIIIGSLSGVAAWIIGPSKGLMVAAEDGLLPKRFAMTNSRGVPIPILITQGIVYTLLCILFLFFPNIDSSYWLLSAMTAQLALIVYFILFAAALRLRYSKPEIKRHFKIPGKHWGIIAVVTVGMLGCCFAIFVGFLPPSEVPMVDRLKFEAILCLGVLVFCLMPFLILFLHQKKQK